MHELAMAQQILEVIEENAKRHSLARVTRAHLKIGKMSAFKAENIKFCLDSYRKNDLVKGLTLDIEETPVELQCTKCAHKWIDIRFDGFDFAHEISHNPLQYQPLPCPKCGSADANVTSGRELQLIDIEGE